MVCFGNTNYDLIIKAKAIADSLGYATNVFLARAAQRGIANHKECNLDDYWHLSIQGFDDIRLMDNKKTDLSSKRNFSWSEISVEEVADGEFFGFELDGNQLHQFNDGTVTHNCRTRVLENRFGLKTSVGRGNLSFTTINLPRIGIEVSKSFQNATFKEREDLLIRKILEKVDFVAEQLDQRFQFQAKAYKKQFPLLMSGLWNGSAALSQDDTIESVINQGTLGIGFIGLAECLVAVFGAHHGEAPEIQEVGLHIAKAMFDRASELSLQYNHNYSILATPAEGLAGRFTKIDRAKHGLS